MLIPGYASVDGQDDAGHDEALWRRYESAVATAGELQETLLATAAVHGDFDAARADEDDPHRAARRQDHAVQPHRVAAPGAAGADRHRLRAVHAAPATRRPGHLPAARAGTRLPGSLAEAGLIQYLVADEV